MPANCSVEPDNWYCDAITNPHSSDDGVDIGTPNDTPIYMPYTGRVIDSGYHVYGGQVVVDVPGSGYSQYMIHLDKINVHPGDIVLGLDNPFGASAIGTSGGGIGDLLLHDGVVQPAQDMSWYEGHSTGYHSEYGIFQGETMPEFNQGWGNKSRQLDPTSTIEQLRNGQTPTALQSGGNPPPQPTGGLCNIPIIGGIICNLETQASTDMATGIAGGIGILAQSLNQYVGGMLHFTVRVATGIVGIIAITTGVIILGKAFSDTTGITQVVEDEVKRVKSTATNAAKVAAVAA